MRIICRFCGGNSDDRWSTCPNCLHRTDVNEIINEISFWDSLNIEARMKFWDYVEIGLDISLEDGT